MSRDTRAVLNLEALHHNLDTIRRLAPQSRVMAVVKANGYGHGLERVVESLSVGDSGRADGFAVATVDEGQRVRRLSSATVLLLEGVTSEDELAMAQRLDFDLVVHSMFQLDLLRQSSPPAPARVWLKADTGMHRLGFNAKDAFDVWHTLKVLPQVSDDVVLMSHLANADDTDDDTTPTQLAAFDQLRQRLDARTCSLANSGGVAAWPDSHFDWVRPGLMLYGASPLLKTDAQALDLQPVMSLHSKLIAINHCQAGDRIGYGGRYTCPADMPVGVVAIGYGDGYPRHAKNGTPLLVDGTRCPLIGRVSMDMLNVDLRNKPTAKIGDPATLWGDGLPVEEIAKHADGVAYELLCGITSRVPTIVLPR